MTIKEQLNNVFQIVFDDDSIQITPEMTANDVEGWDSLSHVNLITAIEGKFDVRFSLKETIKFKNVGDLLKAIEDKVKS